MASSGLYELLAHPERVRSQARVERGDGILRVYFAGDSPRHADFSYRWLRDRDVFASGDRADSIDVLAAYVDAEQRLHVQWKERFEGRRVELSESVHALATLRALRGEGRCEGVVE